VGGEEKEWQSGGNDVAKGRDEGTCERLRRREKEKNPDGILVSQQTVKRGALTVKEILRL